MSLLLRYGNKNDPKYQTALAAWQASRQPKTQPAQEKAFSFSPEYQKIQGERESALKAQFGAAQRGLQQKETQTKDEISTGLNRMTARVGAVGGSVERARQKAVNETSQQYASQYQDLAANEAAAVAGIKGEDAGRMLEENRFEKTMVLQKDQFAQQMAFNYKELDENLKTNMLNAITTMKKAGVDEKSMSKIYAALTGIYGQERTEPFSAASGLYQRDAAAAKSHNMSVSTYRKVYGSGSE
jgi:hypothetical protein